ncbi:SdrD B-like domain-containing protein [Roseivirga echinicomitans]
MRLSFLITFCLLLSIKAYSQDPNLFYYISDGNDRLYTIHRNTGVTTLIGSTGRANIEAIAYYPLPTNRTLYAADAGDFGTLNRTTGAFTLIGEIDGGGTANGSAGAQTLNDVDGLMLDAQSLIMWAVERNSGAPDLLFQINMTTGQFVANAFGAGVDYLEITGAGINLDVDDLAVNPLTGEIYGVSNNSGSNDILFKVNKSTGKFEFIVTLSEDDIEGLSFSNDGRLYSAEGDSDNRLGLIDISTGIISNFHTFTGSDVEGLAALVADANTITGTVYEDLDLDGTKDTGETGIQNVTVYLYLDRNGNGIVDPEDTRVQSTTTDINGNYTFFYATTGTLLATTEFTSYPAGYTLTTDNVEIIVFTDNVNFGETDANNNFGMATGIDCDGDGLSDIEEGEGDADGDGIPNKCDLDSDNDGIRDDVEGATDFDGDGIPNYLDRDSDDDGIPDAIEANGGIILAEYVSSQGNLSGTDSDGNGIIDSRETFAGSGIMKAVNPDSDNDGRRDYLDLDSDNDGILDLREAGGTTDVDADGQYDNITDVNNNGYADALETSPLPIPNTDSAYEIANGLPLRPNYIDIDSDADGIDDTREGYSTSGYRFPTIFADVDQDGIIDFWDVSSGQSPIIPYDNDSDGAPDYIDINSDNDTESDFIEGNDANFDGIADVPNSGLDANGNGLDDAFDGDCVTTGPSSTFPTTQRSEQNISSGNIDLTSSDIELVYDSYNGDQIIGIRFPNVMIAQGADIGNAYVQFEADGATSGALTVRIEGELSTNAGALTTSSYNVSSRTRTVQFKNWSPPAWSDNDRGSAQRTVNVADIIEEIVGQVGWSSGNSIVLIFSGDTGQAGFRRSENNVDLVIALAGGPSIVCSSNVSLPDENGNGEYDFRETDIVDSDFDGIPDDIDIDDDNDGITDIDEGCADVTVPAGNGTAVAESGARTDSRDNAIDGVNGNFARFRDDGAAMDITLRGGAIVPVGTNITVTAQIRNNGPNTITISESTNGVDFVNPVTYTFSVRRVYEDKIYPLTTRATHVRVLYNRDGGDLRLDNVAYAGFTTNICRDSDGDGIPDRLDLDSDNDGVLDIVEAGGGVYDADKDGRVDNYIEGNGPDGLASVFEPGRVGNSSNLPNLDTDNDGFKDFVDLDSDNDGLFDILEAGGKDVNKDGRVDNAADNDGDGIANIFDVNDGGNPLADPDADNDGLPNRVDIDSDGDGIVDVIESQASTSPVLPTGNDNDNDGIDNAFDSDNSGTPTVPVDTDGDGTPDYLDLNSDNDGLVDAIEGWDTNGNFSPNTTPVGTDTDGDGLDDAYDTVNGRNATTNVYDTPGANNSYKDYPNQTTSGTDERDWREKNVLDTDLDGIPNYIDIDDDNDGVLDVDEGLGVTCPTPQIVAVSTDLSSVGSISTLYDGIQTQQNFYFSNNQNFTVQRTIFQIQFLEPVALTQIRFLLDTDGTGNSFLRNGVNYVVQGSNNASSWTNITGTITANGSGAGEVQDVSLAGNTTSYLYYRLRWLSGASITWDPWIEEIVVTSAACTPVADKDTDGDGIPDYLDLDSDNDGIFDIIEAGGVDVDKDGRVDNYVESGSNGWADTFDNVETSGTPHLDPDTDGDGKKNRIDIDSDGDGITDLIESQATTGTPVVPIGLDSDQDGIDNAFDVHCAPCGTVTGVPTVPVNTDGGFAISDSTPDYLDTDSDNDGLPDIIEGWDTNGNYTANVTPFGTDADNDGLDDAFDKVLGPNPVTNSKNNQTSNSFPNLTTSGTPERDWREINNVTCAPGEVDGNLVIWLRADKGGINWLDQSNNFVSLTRIGTPTVGSINFNPTNNFNGNAYYTANLSINAAANPDLVVIAVYKPNKDNAGAVWGENDGSFDRYMQDASGQNNAVSNGSGTENNITGLFANGQTTLSSVIFDESAINGSQVYVNGKNELSFTAIHGPETSNNLQIGAIGTSTSRFNGEIAEIIVYNQLLSTGNDRQKIESYLALKYGITLSADTDGDGTSYEAGEGDYLLSNGTTMWDASEVATFQNNVAGIGRDDASCFVQLQSKSENADAIVTIGLDSNNNGLENSNAQNESTFSNDLSALVWGHDGEAMYDDSKNIDYDPNQVKSRLNREWRVQETGTVGTVTVRFDVSNLLGPGDVVGANNEAQIVMLVDEDGDFSSGANIVTQSFVVDGDGFVYFQVDFADGNYYTLASGEENALPITLISFSGNSRGDHNELNWTTVSEINNSLFRIDRSADGETFETVGYKDGAGTTKSTIDYLFRDYEPLKGKNYYRLIDIDNNGVENVSEMILVNYYKRSDIEVKAYPNPIRRGETLYLSLDQEAELGLIKMHQINGTEVLIQTERTGDRLAINSPQVNQGVYLLSVMVNGQLHKFKIVVTH